MKNTIIIILSIFLIINSIRAFYLQKDLKKCIELTKDAQSETKQMQDLCRELIDISKQKDTIINQLQQNY